MSTAASTTPTVDTFISRLYESMQKIPFGRKLFAKALCLKAPYFDTIKPEVITLESGKAEWKIKNRRGIHNHLGTVHAIAMCNLAELCAGTVLEMTIPSHLRWIPKGMEVNYLKKATTDLTGSCVINQTLTAGEVPLLVEVKDTSGEVVFNATIKMWLSEKKQ